MIHEDMACHVLYMACMQLSLVVDIESFTKKFTNYGKSSKILGTELKTSG